jgi:hypothetical protein
MTRIVLVAVLLLGGAPNAQADIDTYDSITRRPRSDAVLQADTDYCTRTVGRNWNGVPTSARFKRCMLSRGWRFARTTREHTWRDPETGLVCKEFKVFGITGSHCSNY